MRIALLSDVHANLPALEAVLRGIREKSPDKILSLGDQINLGPLPAETLALLRSEGVVCLSGNHERYVLSVLRGDSAYDGANFESLRFQAQHVTRDEISFPDTLVWEGVTFCHALPGDDRFPVYDPEKALPELTARYAYGFTHIISGWTASAASAAWTTGFPASRPMRYLTSNPTGPCFAPIGLPMT